MGNDGRRLGQFRAVNCLLICKRLDGDRRSGGFRLVLALLGGLFVALAATVSSAQAPPSPSPPSGAVAEESPGRQALARRARALKDRLAGWGFHVLVQPPFVVIGDESAPVVQERATGTVAWAVERLKERYFSRDPRSIIEIWLFKDTESYERHAEEFFGAKPTTPYGYYSPSHRALVMNISTGGGTLVHEIVHPFIAANFPGCPSWFNEGLASLYEQCRERNGVIWGDTNWRLKGLQQAIAAGRVGAFEDLCATSSEEFYAEDQGLYYAQARYLCYYLQEQGLLVDFYRRFSTSQDDPTGYKTLQTVLGEPDMAEFEKQWRAYVMKLRF